jgi:uncharacterized protein
VIIDVSSILKDLGGKIDISGSVDVPCDEFSDIKIITPVQIDGNITNNGKTMELSAHANCRASTVCARCLKDIEIKLDFDITEMLAQGENQYDDEVYTFEHDSVDLTEIVINNILMNISGKYLCKEDCKGLCPKCGNDLNNSDCGCDTAVIDPRWAALANIMEGSSDSSD